MSKKLLPEIRPGKILLKDFLEPMGLTASQLARDIDVPPSRITDIVKNGRPITMDTAVRLGLYFKMSTEFWVNLQRGYDLRIAKRDLEPKLAAKIRSLAHRGVALADRRLVDVSKHKQNRVPELCLLSRETYHSRCGVSRQRRAQYANKQSSGTVLPFCALFVTSRNRGFSSVARAAHRRRSAS